MVDLSVLGDCLGYQRYIDYRRSERRAGRPALNSSHVTLVVEPNTQ
jgi:hypothetical protein